MASTTIAAEEKPEQTILPISDEIVYSTFSKTSKRWISIAASFSAMFSGLSSFIYYPALTPIAEDLHTSIGRINLTITAYLIVSGLAPSIIGDLADRTGRRPLYIATTNTAPSLGPILGGLVAQRLGWRWIFWLLAIASGCQLLGMTLFFPETARRIVGNGSLSPRGLNKTMRDYLRGRSISVVTPSAAAPRTSFYWPNPLAGLSIILDKKSALTMLFGGMFYTVHSCLAASLSTICIDLYGLSYLEAGLVYLPAGIGGILAAYSTEAFPGRLLDHDYQKTAKKYDIEVNRPSGDDMSIFPIEEARLRSSWVFALISVVAVVGYGWALQRETVKVFPVGCASKRRANVQQHIAVPLTLQLFTGSTMVALFTMCGTLLTDLNQENPSSAQATQNLIRCSLAAAGIAALNPIIEALDVGWCFTLYAGFCLGTLPLLIALRRFGNERRANNRVDP
ncbi:MAG: hypothetical protein Q9178_006194 [Gyalolechia marmorata]